MRQVLQRGPLLLRLLDPLLPRRAQLLGDLKGTKRTVVLFGADGQPWEKTFTALTTGLVADGPVTLVLERAQAGSPGALWAPLPVAREALDAARASEPGTPRVPAPLYGADGEVQEDEEAAAARLDEQLSVEQPGSEVSAAVLGTLGILALLLLTGFSP